MVRELEKGLGQESSPSVSLGDVLECLYSNGERIVIDNSQGSYTVGFGIDPDAQGEQYMARVEETGATFRGCIPGIPVVMLRPAFLAQNVLRIAESRVSELNSI